jgi:hypothetical protein
MLGHALQRIRTKVAKASSPSSGNGSGSRANANAEASSNQASSVVGGMRSSGSGIGHVQVCE